MRPLVFHSVRTSHEASVTNHDLMPIIVGASSVQMCLKLCQLSLLASKKESARALTSAAAAFVTDRVLLNKSSFLSFLFWAKPIKLTF